MLNAWINTKKIWYAFYEDTSPILDENGDYTGETKSGYSEPHFTRANLSAARGTVESDIFGTNVKYSKTMSTAKMNLGIDEQTLIWDEEPVLLESGKVDPETAKYRVAAIARGHYHVHYALRQMNPKDKEGSDESDDDPIGG